MAERDQVPANTDWEAMAQSDPAIRDMLRAGVDMNRENYLDAATNGNPPEEWNEEAEMGLPPQLQGFQGVGLSELPAGPMPIQMGQPGQGPKVGPLGQPVVQLEAKPIVTEVTPPKRGG